LGFEPFQVNGKNFRHSPTFMLTGNPPIRIFKNIKEKGTWVFGRRRLG
jgi:hypothetical protein